MPQPEAPQLPQGGQGGQQEDIHASALQPGGCRVCQVVRLAVSVQAMQGDGHLKSRDQGGHLHVAKEPAGLASCEVAETSQDGPLCVPPTPQTCAGSLSVVCRVGALSRFTA